jgi:hypothetical protein
VGDERHFVFRQKLLGEDGSLRWGVVMVKPPGLFSPKFGSMSSRVFMQSPQNVAVEPKLTVWPVRTDASRYHNCCIDGGTSPEYFGHYLVLHGLNTVNVTISGNICLYQTDG